MSNWKKILIPVATLALLAACGGGGGGGGGGAGNLGDKSFPAAAATQNFANSAVEEVLDVVVDIREAELADDVPIGARIVGPPTGATTSGSLDCADFGAGGSGTVDYTFTYTSGGRPVSYVAEYNNCAFSSGGYTFTMNGEIEEEWSDYEDESHYTISINYDITYTYTGPGYSDSGTLTSSQVCTQDGESYECNYSVGGGYALDEDYEVDIDGDITTIEYALIEGANVTLEINGWVYNSALERATAGTIEIVFANGSGVLITATGTGYTVAVTISGTTTSYNVAF